MEIKNRKECLKEYGSDYMIQKEIKKGKLYKVGNSLYSKDMHIPKIAILSFQYPNAIVTMDNAFYIHELTDVIPNNYCLQTDRNASKIKDKEVIQYFAPSNFFKEGLITVSYKNYKVNIYNKERMLIELIRYKNKMPFDYYKEVIRNYRYILPSLDMQLIQDYACQAPKSSRIMEVLQTEVF